MTSDEVRSSLTLASRHLRRVQSAWDPPEWDILSNFAMLAIEAAVVAASLHKGWRRPNQHIDKVASARRLTREDGLPEVATLLIDLNEMRKSENYGDVPAPENLDAEDVASAVERYIDAVTELASK